ncbi:MAG: right-handed parallel beta-helix repeat-containing protein [Planctomycetota bacterium]
MSTTNRISILIVTVQLCLQVCYAGDFYVNPGQSIQAAIDSTSYGDTVHVAAGSYVENITLKNGVALIGAGPSTTVIDGNQSGSVIDSPACDPNTLLSNFMITNGYSGNGGGLNMNYFSSPTVSNCIFSENIAIYGGGGIHRNPGCHPTISHCTFIGNRSDFGGAICNNGFSLDYGPYPHIVNCLFIGNSASRGGAIYSVDNSNPTVTDCTFHANTAISDGSGIYNEYVSDPIISNCIFWNNNSLLVSEIYNDQSAPEISNCNIAGCGGSGVGWDASMGIDGGGNIDDDPLFLDPNGVDGIAGTTDDDLRLSSGSPCIDAGDNTAVTEPNDIDGLPRIVDGDCDGTATVDMGAHELDWLYAGDFEGDDCDVDLGDFAVMAQSWLLDNPAIDIVPYQDPDGIIDLGELSLLAAHWLQTAAP